MHEFALAQAVVAEVEKIVEKGYRVEKLRIYLGELQSVDREVFEQYVSMMLREVQENVDVEYVDEEAEFSCRVCGYKWSLSELELDEDEREAIHFLPEAVYSYVKCPRCSSRDYAIERGRGVRISIEYSE